MRFSLDRASVKEVVHQKDTSLLHRKSADHVRGSASAKSEKSSVVRRSNSTSGTRWRAKLKSALHLNVTAPEAVAMKGDADVPVLAPHPAKAKEELRYDNQKPPTALDNLKDFVHHPVKTIESAIQSQSGQAVAQTLLAKEVTHSQDVELVQAHDKIEAAETREEREEAVENYNNIGKLRQDLFVRWSLDRHVTKLRQLEPYRERLLPRYHFIRIDSTGATRQDWGAYARHVLTHEAHEHANHYVGAYTEPPNPTQESLSAAMERLIVVTAPLQELGLKIRGIYRWEHRRTTSLCLAASLCFWYYNILSVVAIGSNIAFVLYRRTNNKTIEDLKEQVKRIEDHDQSALSLDEVIGKYGNDKWADVLIQQQGPRLLRLLDDMSGVLEQMSSIYQWRSPWHTNRALVILGGLCAFAALTPTHLLVKSITLFIGVVFFGLYPIASWHPEYRYLVSPIKWFLWNVPTHADWAISRLQSDGRDNIQEILEKRTELTTEATATRITAVKQRPVGEIELFTYPATYKPDKKMVHQGNLIVTTHGLRFETKMRGKHIWSVPYNRLSKMEKVSFSFKLRRGEDILFTSNDGEQFRADDLLQRNEVFNQIVGYSGIDWQIIG